MSSRAQTEEIVKSDVDADQKADIFKTPFGRTAIKKSFMGTRFARDSQIAVPVWPHNQEVPEFYQEVEVESEQPEVKNFGEFVAPGAPETEVTYLVPKSEVDADAPDQEVVWSTGGEFATPVNAQDEGKHGENQEELEYSQLLKKALSMSPEMMKKLVNELNKEQAKRDGPNAPKSVVRRAKPRWPGLSRAGPRPKKHPVNTYDKTWIGYGRKSFYVKFFPKETRILSYGWY